MKLRVKATFNWVRLFSALPEPIQIPAGAPVEEKGRQYWVRPSHFKGDETLHHDAVYYGCPVDPDNVVTA